ncbi:hypothetical protein G9A89_011061 [Geosiphon pyriformis]|nr:hypothetical protein G9A89_011061 [Geosiphon pyriformis]
MSENSHLFLHSKLTGVPPFTPVNVKSLYFAKMAKFRIFIVLTAYKRHQIGGNHFVTVAEIKALKAMHPGFEVGK